MHPSTLPQQEGPALEPLLSQVITLTEPDRVYRRGPVLMVVMPAGCVRPHSEIKAVLDPLFRDSGFWLTLQAAHELQAQLDKGQLLYSTLCVVKNLVYDSRHNPVPRPLGDRLERVRQKAGQQFWGGYRRAAAFLQGARFYWAGEELRLTTFMLHQASELLLRALILTFTGQEVRTHTLSELGQHLRRFAPDLYGLLAESGEDDPLVEQLEKAYTATRYNDNFAISPDEVAIFLQRVHRLHGAARQFFEESMAAYSTPFLTPTNPCGS